MRRKSYIAEHIDNEYRRKLKEKEKRNKTLKNRGNYYGYTRNDK